MKTNFNIENINQNFIISKYLTIADSLFANIAKHFTENIAPMQLEGTGTELIKCTIEETRKCKASYEIKY